MDPVRARFSATAAQVAARAEHEIEPVREQLVRARRFADLGYFDVIEPGELTPERLISTVLSALQRKPAPIATVDLGGLVRVVARARALFNGRGVMPRGMAKFRDVAH